MKQELRLILTLDPEGYPTDECLKSIEEVKITKRTDCLDVLRQIKTIWAYSDWGWKEEENKSKYTFNISTAGWSGNESIIGAMRSNFIFWSICWVQHRRGGHFIFEVDKK